MGWQGGKLTSPMWASVILTNTHTWKYLVYHVQNPPTHPYLFHMEMQPKILETLNIRSSLQEKIPTLKGARFTTHHYISTRPPLFLGTQKILCSLTIEFLEISHSLTWSLEGFWLVPHQCLHFDPCVLILQVSISTIWSPELTNDFRASSVGVFCKNRVISHITASKTKNCCMV